MESTDLNTATTLAQPSSPAIATEPLAEGEQGAAGVGEEEERRRKKKEKRARERDDDDEVYLPFKVAAAVPISPDTKLFRFQAPPGHGHLLRTLPGPGTLQPLRSQHPDE
jgi:hypothetical protein